MQILGCTLSNRNITDREGMRFRHSHKGECKNMHSKWHDISLDKQTSCRITWRKYDQSIALRQHHLPRIEINVWD
uniref:Uncharacterized protein n=1 Tax=Rhizophora mucronata TaxID=61149 RepID=A0A2P2PE40_RHIMU